MTNAERQARTCWADTVKARDSKRCIFCGESNGCEAHHVFFASSHPGWEILFDTDFGVTLCPHCHRGDGNPKAIHGSSANPELFKRELEIWLSLERWEKIISVSFDAPDEKPNYKQITIKLKAEYELVKDNVFEEVDIRATPRKVSEKWQ